MDINDITVAFAGFNMRHFAVLAIESFLLHYPEMRDNVVFFDDKSTDRTVDDLQRRGIKVITWTEKWYNEYMNLKDSNYFDSTTQIMSSRVCFIMREIMEQVETKYLLMSDGDVVFKKGGFIEGYIDEFNNTDHKIIFHEEHSIYPGLVMSSLDGINDKQLEYYRRYESLYLGNPDPNFNKSELDSGVYSSMRVHLLHTIMDLDYFKSIDMLGDRLIKDTFDLMYGGLVDTGTDFYHQIMDRGVPFGVISNEFVFGDLVHWGWISSSNRDVDKKNLNSRRNQFKEIESVINTPEMKDILRRTDINPMKIMRTFLRNIDKKNLF